MWMKIRILIKRLIIQEKVYFQVKTDIYYRLLERGINGKYKGDGFQLGGTVICDYRGEVIYQHNQKDFYDFPSEDEIFQTVATYYIENKDKS